MIRAQTRFGKFMLGSTPRVVGTVAQAKTLSALAKQAEPACDIVEIRLDLIGPATPQWLDHARAIEKAGRPIILTIRLASEGGKWEGRDADRAAIFEQALPHVTAADIEFRSPLLEQISALACRHQKALIISYHDFDRTPPADELKNVVTKAANYGTVIKIATLARTEDDLGTLRDLFKLNCSAALCVLGMGPLGLQSRVEFPKLGSCLTYGYLDEPVAPGQPAARDLMKQMRTL